MLKNKNKESKVVKKSDKRNKNSSNLSIFFKPMWRKLLLVAVILITSLLVISKTPLNFIKPSSAAYNRPPIVTASSLGTTGFVKTGPYSYQITLRVKASDPDSSTPPKVVFRYRLYRDCNTDITTDWISRSPDGYYYKTIDGLTAGNTYEFTAKARDIGGKYSIGANFCTQSDGSPSSGWVAARSFNNSW